MLFKEWFESSLMSNPREKMRQFTTGQRDPEHLGKHTPETLTQELFSLKNTKPMFRNKKWQNRFDEIVKIVGQIKDKKVRESIKKKANDCLSGEC